MTTQEHPKPVVIRKNIVVIATVVLMLLCALIGYNLIHSTQRNQSADQVSNSPAQTIASESDTAWYQELQVKKAVKPQPIQSGHSSQVEQRAAVTEVPTPQVPQPELNQQEVQEAMSAPITSNQLIGVLPTPDLTQDNPSTAGAHSEAMSHDNNENEQSEKKAFVHMNDKAHDIYLSSSLQNPITPYELQAGAIIPAILITGINSDLPGQITGQVRSNVYDSISGKHVLIPQGAKLTGLYDSQVAYGQERVLVIWRRVIFPNGQSMDLEGMPGIDLSGYGGFKDRVNNHYGKLAGSVLLMTVLGAGAQLSQPQNSNNSVDTNPTVAQTIAQSMGTNVVNTASLLTNKNINLQPTLEIQPGYEFNVSVTKDMVFPAAYQSS